MIYVHVLFRCALFILRVFFLVFLLISTAVATDLTTTASMWHGIVKHLCVDDFLSNLVVRVTRLPISTKSNPFSA